MASTQTSEPLKYKTWVLKVSVHCEGCKRKVKKILQTLPGVHGIDIEIKHQRVAVTGDVTPETLINKLVKAGKHAVLLPEKPDRKPGNPNQPENINEKTEKTSTQESISEDAAVPGKELNPSATKSEIPVQDFTKVSQTNVAGGGVTAKSGENGGGKVDESAGKSEVEGKSGEGEKVAEEVKVEEKKLETGSAGNQATKPVAEKKDVETEKPGATMGGGAREAKKIKKKKKGQNITKNGIEETSLSASAPLNEGGGGQPTTFPANQSPPRHHGYQYSPPHYYSPPPPAPVYGVSYNTAHPPGNSYTGSYYAAPPPYSYAYSYSGSEMQPMYPPPSSDFESYPRQPLDSIEMFSDENPNGCSAM